MKQLIIGIALVIIGFICSTIFKIGIFSNIGWIIYGMLFLLNPVYPNGADIRAPKIKMYVRISGAIVILFGLLIKFEV